MNRLITVLYTIILLIAILLTVNCNGQPRSNYEIYSDPVPGATKYHFFLEKKSTTTNYRLTDGMDYLQPSVTDLKVGESPLPTYTLEILNDGSEYTVGIVAENLNGFYSGMGVSTGTVGIVPSKPGGVGLRKK